MDLIIFKSIIYGDLKPWVLDAVNDKFYRQNLSPDFIDPKQDINNYYKALKELHKSKSGLFAEDGLDVYIMQPDSDIQYEIAQPLVETNLEEPSTSTQKFYHYLLINETTRLTNRVFKCFNKQIGEIQQRELIQNTVKSCKDLLLRIGTDKDSFPNTPLTEYVIPQLISNIIRLLKETELTYPSFLTELPTDKNEIFGELLNMPIPDTQIDKTTAEFQNVCNVLQGVDDYKFEKDTRFAFGFKGNKEKLKSVLFALNRDIKLLNEDKTEVEDLYNVLTSKDLKLGAPQIYLGCETLEFAYIVKKLELSFSNFTATTIDSSNLFYSKKGNVIKKGSLYNANQKEPYKKENIDNIFSQL